MFETSTHASTVHGSRKQAHSLSATSFVAVVLYVHNRPAVPSCIAWRSGARVSSSRSTATRLLLMARQLLSAVKLIASVDDMHSVGTRWPQVPDRTVHSGHRALANRIHTVESIKRLANVSGHLSTSTMATERIGNSRKNCTHSRL